MESNTGSPTPMSGVFARKSSGVIRQISTTDTLIYGLMQIAIGYVIFIIAAWPLYKNASLEWATLLTLIGAIPLGIVYALFSSVRVRLLCEAIRVHQTLDFEAKVRELSS